MPIRSPAHASFGHAIRQIRNELGFSQEDLADACELDRTYISGIERGTRNPSLTNILKIAAALHTRPTELFALAETIEGNFPDRRLQVAARDPDESSPTGKRP